MKSYTHFTPEERICLEEMYKKGKKNSEIARILGRNKSSISRELKRNSSKQGVYNMWGAYSKYKNRRKACKRHKRIVEGTGLYFYIIEKLEQFWSPALIAATWNRDHKNDTISFSTIYKAIKDKMLPKITAQKNLRRRGKKRYAQRSKFNTIHPDRTIHDWSKEIKERMRFGDWEGDTIHGAFGKGGLLTLVDRKSRSLIAIKISDFSQKTLYNAMLEAFDEIKPKSITLDNGSEFAMFREIEKALNTTVYFTDPHSPWQRGSNENLNGLLRFFFPKGFNFHAISQSAIDDVVRLINNRPRFCLGLKSPNEIFCCT